MNTPIKNRIESIDLLKGLVMVIMALDHVRDYFHFSANYFDPTDPTQSTLPLFFTRWITHFCAPTFSFLAGLSACMAGRRKTKIELSAFLVKRGLWLVFIEITIVAFAWSFDPQFRGILLGVIWVLGISMIVLAALIHLPRTGILIFSCIMIFGHNLLDGIHSGNLGWELLHQQSLYRFANINFLIGYPMIPWIAVMALGYYFGGSYDPLFGAEKRRKLFNIIGLSAIAFFIILRATNIYGNPKLFLPGNSFSQGLISFLNPAKYPPSLDYLLMTLGVAIVFLANSENLKGKVVNFFSTFGKVPFFYYILHLYLIHFFAMIAAQLTGHGWQLFVLPAWISFVPEMKGYGFGLVAVYGIWIGIIIVLYPICKKFADYKMKHKEKWWLSYL